MRARRPARRRRSSGPRARNIGTTVHGYTYRNNNNKKTRLSNIIPDEGRCGPTMHDNVFFIYYGYRHDRGQLHAGRESPGPNARMPPVFRNSPHFFAATNTQMTRKSNS